MPYLGVSAQLLVTRPSLDFCLYFIFIAEFPISDLSDPVYLTGLIFLNSPLKLRLARLNFQVLCVQLEHLCWVINVLISSILLTFLSGPSN